MKSYSSKDWEQYISFELAIIAKSKGFKGMCHAFYTEEGRLCPSTYSGHNNTYKMGYAAPSQAILQKWLREKHKLIVEVEFYDYKAWSYNLFNPKPVAIVAPVHKSYEESLEEGLKEAIVSYV